MLDKDITKEIYDQRNARVLDERCDLRDRIAALSGKAEWRLAGFRACGTLVDMYALLGFINLFSSGILAGLEISIHYGFHSPTIALEEKSQIVLRQGLVRRLRWLVPAFFVPMALSGIAEAVIDWHMPGQFFRLAALLAIIAWIYVRVVGTVRINSATLDWNSDAPPKDWRGQIGKSERFHIVGTWAAILAFAFFLIAATL